MRYREKLMLEISAHLHQEIYKSNIAMHTYIIILLICSDNICYSQIRKDDILVQFAEIFHTSYTNWELDVMFTFGRLVVS